MNINFSSLRNHTIRNFNVYLLEKFIRGFGVIFILKFFSEIFSKTFLGYFLYYESILFILISFSGLSINKIIIRLLNEKKYSSVRIIKTSFTLNLISTFIVIILSIVFIDFKDAVGIKFFISFSFTLVSSLFIALESYYDSVKSPHVYIFPKLVIFIFIFILKIYAIIEKKDIDLFLIFNALEYLLLGSYYFYKLSIKKFNSIIFDKQIIRELLKSAFPLLITSSAVILSLKLDQLLIKGYLGIDSNAIYGSSIKIIDYLIILPTLFLKTVYPNFIILNVNNKLNFNKTLNRSFYLLLFFSVISILIINVFSKNITLYIFNDQSGEISFYLKLLSPMILFYCIQNLYNNLIYTLKLEKKYMFRSLIGLILNLVLNIILIPYIGILGAVISTLFTLFFSSIIFHLIDKQMRSYFKILIKFPF